MSRLLHVQIKTWEFCNSRVRRASLRAKRLKKGDFAGPVEFKNIRDCSGSRREIHPGNNLITRPPNFAA
jgi:hypothetical protein